MRARACISLVPCISVVESRQHPGSPNRLLQEESSKKTADLVGFPHHKAPILPSKCYCGYDMALCLCGHGHVVAAGSTTTGHFNRI